ncbi:PLC-like phosphodiesterase [Punctularia strigosozonata HHB-11173 SS5]|uniref:PLC-like phosphodiesterase n=1 Tax=Punctularia strigosozonata (strain HHB-11173) TaxID=741275 RepID=UPI0004416B1C|nr:PLC-like phosphodiesterase [Punctularia strigosozonata HHB-11173 SS5]EIN06469.1 PLC-like phosphodiesterase [Punctularia strigosozonata HHB-11173 SS5]
MHLSKAFLAAATLLGSLAQVNGAIIPEKFKRATVCNGRAEFCDRSYANITYLASHDSAFFSKDPLALARTQEIDIPSQLQFGARMLQAQAHTDPLDDDALHFCHTSCFLFDGGLVSDYLKKVKTFMDANPNEVVTLLFTNGDGLSMNKVWKPAFVEAGIDQIAFVPPTPGTPIKQSDWPTLGDMIASGKRVVVFMDAGADDATDNVDFIMPEFQMIWEPPFSSTDPSFPCKVDRINGPLDTADHMYMINHNLNKEVLGIDSILTSDPRDAATTNGVTSILADANGCTSFGAGRAPAFVLLDFITRGEALKAVDILNGFSS